jgi:catechol 2,3-dioxygenase-like lactoylglutathione lyase family enzyme
MKHDIQSIRTFIGSKDFNTSRAFYTAFGFSEIRLNQTMSYFKIEAFGFYLQDAYVKEWIENSMVFIEVADVDVHLEAFKKLHLKERFPSIKISEVHRNDWGDEYFVHDPAGVLIHIGTFK